jgi:hypothetical protein
MNFVFAFKHINASNQKYPICRIELNGNDIFTGKVVPQIKVDATANEEENILRIYFENKEGKDTILDENNNISQDLNFELEKLTIDGLDLQHLIWQSKYVSKNTVIDSCLFFGPKGHWEIKFNSPILKWFLKTDQEKNNNDPDWEIDYNYYEEACQKLSKIQTR